MSSSSKGDPSELRQRIKSLLASGDAASAMTLIDELATQHNALAAKVAEQDSQLAWLRRMLFGRKSEKLSLEELGQLVLAYGGTEA